MTTCVLYNRRAAGILTIFRTGLILWVRIYKTRPVKIPKRWERKGEGRNRAGGKEVRERQDEWRRERRGKAGGKKEVHIYSLGALLQ